MMLVYRPDIDCARLVEIILAVQNEAVPATVLALNATKDVILSLPQELSRTVVGQKLQQLELSHTLLHWGDAIIVACGVSVSR